MEKILEQAKTKIILTDEEQFTNAVENFYNNTEALNEIRKFYKIQLRNLKCLRKKEQMVPEEFNIQKEKLDVLYKKHTDEIHKHINIGYSISTDRFDKINIWKEKTDYTNFQIWKEEKQEIKKIKKNTSLNKDTKKEQIHKVKDTYQKIYKKIVPNKIALIALIAVPIITLASLLCSYLVYFPFATGKLDFTNSAHLISFILVIFSIILMGGFLAFVVKKVTRRVFLDNNQKLGQISFIGFVGAFVDTIGVGSFAITVAALKGTNTVKDTRLIPGTLNMGLAIPNLLAGAIFVSAVEVETWTLVSLILAGMVGSFLGSHLVRFVNAKNINLGMSVVLFVVAIIMILIQVEVLGEKIASAPRFLDGWKLALGIILFVILGGIQSFGIGFYAPALAVISLLGMNVMAAFPIMTCASGFGYPMTIYAFHRQNNYLPKVSFGLMIGGVFGTLAAFLIVFMGFQMGLGIKTDDFTYWLKWLTVGILFYATTMLFLNFLNAWKIEKENLKNHKEDINYFAKLDIEKALLSIDKEFRKICQSGISTKIDFKALLEKEKIKKLVWK